jgi:hypothetical protein
VYKATADVWAFTVVESFTFHRAVRTQCCSTDHQNVCLVLSILVVSIGFEDIRRH